MLGEAGALSVAAAPRPALGRYERPGLIAAIIGLVLAVGLILFAPDANTGELATADSIDAPGAFTPSAPGAAAAGAQLGAVTPPKFGTYTNDTTTTTGSAETGGETTVKNTSSFRIEAVPDAPQDGVYLQRVNVTGGSSRQQSVWKADGEYQISRAGDGSGECVYEPPLLSMKLPLAVGQTWTATGTCNDNRFKTSQSLTTTVAGTSTVTFAGAPVEVYVLELSGEVNQSGSGFGGTFKSVVHLKETSLFAPSLGVSVQNRTSMVQSVDAGGRTRSIPSKSETTLRSFQP